MQAVASTDRFTSELLPKIRKHANINGYRMGLRDERHETFVGCVISEAYLLYAKLASQGRDNLIYFSPLARFAIQKVIAHHARESSKADELVVDVPSPQEDELGVSEWLSTLSPKLLNIAQLLIETNGNAAEVARIIGTNHMAILRMRTKLIDSWIAYQQG